MAYPSPLLALIEASVVEFFTSTGISGVQAIPSQWSATTEQAKAFSASLGFSGDRIKGALVVIADAALLQATNPQREFKRTLKDEDHADWIGEMANQVVGALKRRAAGYRVDFMLSTPTVARGMALQVTSSPKTPPVDLWFSVAGHTVRLHFSAALDPSVSFAGEPATDGQAASGDTLLF